MTQDMSEIASVSELTHVDPGYRHVLRIVTALVCAPIVLVACVVEFALSQQQIGFAGSVLVPVVLACFFLIAVTPARRWIRLGYDDRGDRLRVARGFMWRTDTVVPYKRIQHIDIGQGPLERAFGIAHLVVHTAGTHNNIVTLPGLPVDRAETMREEMRQFIRRQDQ
jgi:uncharacterized protein